MLKLVFGILGIVFVLAIGIKFAKTEKDKLQKVNLKNIILITLILIFSIYLFIDGLYLVGATYAYNTELSAADLLNYIASSIIFIGTIILSYFIYKSQKKSTDREFIANNECLVFGYEGENNAVYYENINDDIEKYKTNPVPCLLRSVNNNIKNTQDVFIRHIITPMGTNKILTFKVLNLKVFDYTGHDEYEPIDRTYSNVGEITNEIFVIKYKLPLRKRHIKRKVFKVKGIVRVNTNNKVFTEYYINSSISLHNNNRTNLNRFTNHDSGIVQEQVND